MQHDFVPNSHRTSQRSRPPHDRPNGVKASADVLVNNFAECERAQPRPLVFDHATERYP